MPTDEALRAAYPDLLGSEPDRADLALIAALHRRYTAPEPPPALRAAVAAAALELARSTALPPDQPLQHVGMATRDPAPTGPRVAPGGVQAAEPGRVPSRLASVAALPRRRARLLAVAAVLLLAVGVATVAARPAGAGAVGPGLVAWLQAAVGVRAPHDPRTPVSLTPAPPFAVYQPAWLPADLSRRGVTYNPATVDPVTGLHHAYPANTGAIDAARLGLRFAPSDAFFLLRDTGGQHGGPALVLLERRAAPGEPLPAGAATTVLGQRGTLGTAADGRLLTAVVNGTWLQIWTTLSQADLTRVAQSLRLTDRGVGAMAPRPGPTAVPAPSPVPGSFPAFQRPTYLPPSLDGGAGAGYFALPPGAQGRVMPPLAGGGAPNPASAAEVARMPLLQQLSPQLHWAEQAWDAVGGGVFGITFGGPQPLTYLQIGPARLDAAPAGAVVTTPAGRSVWVLDSGAGGGFQAHWTSGAPLDFREAYLAHNPDRATATVVLWVHGDALVWLRSTLPRRDLFQFIDGLTAAD